MRKKREKEEEKKRLKETNPKETINLLSSEGGDFTANSRLSLPFNRDNED